VLEPGQVLVQLLLASQKELLVQRLEQQPG
jgi:hypothetical protein